MWQACKTDYNHIYESDFKQSTYNYMLMNVVSSKELMKLRKYKLSKLIWENEYINCLRRNWKIFEIANNYIQKLYQFQMFSWGDLW